MSRNSVAVLDIRSSEVTVLVGERGVNNTFVFHASRTEQYDGYDNGAFYDPEGLAEAVKTCVLSVEKTIDARLKKLYVGVPGEFLLVEPKEQSAGFSKRRRITSKETEALFEGGKADVPDHRLIRATSMLYITQDNRRAVDPVGLTSASLTGLLSYFYCTEYFARTMENVFKGMKISLVYLPALLAMASYLIPAETRDEYALFLDCGYLSSTISIVLGGGILAEETHWVGRIRVIVRLMETFGLEYEAASVLLQRANLFVKDAGKFEFIWKDTVYEIDARLLSETVKEGLDEICEALSGFVEECSGRELDFKPIYVTGEGLSGIRGALEHISKRLNRVTYPVSPDLPYYNKPSMSSRIALVDMACEDNRKRGFLRRLFNTFGG